MPALAHFTSPLQVADVGRAEQYRPIRMLLTDLSYGVGSRESTDRIVVPAGFCCDGASVPRGFRLFFAPWGVYAAAAIIHDYLYASSNRPRDEADAIFHEAIIQLRSELDETDGASDNDPTFAGKTMAWLAWIGVRLFGAGSYASGSETYRIRAERARDRLLEKGYDTLAANVILDPEIL